MVISVYNHKGGTGKTTTTINLGAVLTQQGKNVLLVDLDPQANLTYSLGVRKDTSHEVALSSENVVETDEGFDLLPNLTTPQFLVDYQFPSTHSLKEELSDFFENYDYVLIDCPPAMNITVVNALLASEGILITAMLDALSLEALRQVLTSIEELSSEYNHKFNFTGVLPVMVDSRRQLSKEVKEFILENFDTILFENHIRMNVKVAEAPSHGQSVLEYAAESNGSKDYTNAANEFLTKTSLN